MTCSAFVNGVCTNGFPATLACSDPYDFYYKKYIVRIPRCLDERWQARFLKETGAPTAQMIEHARTLSTSNQTVKP